MRVWSSEPDGSRRNFLIGEYLRASSLLGLVVVAVFFWIVNHEAPLRVAVPQGLEGDALRNVIEEFSRSYGGTIEVRSYPQERLHQYALQQVGRSEPEVDLLLVEDPWIPPLVSTHEGGLLELDMDALGAKEWAEISDGLDSRSAPHNWSQLAQRIVRPALDVGYFPYRRGGFRPQGSLYGMPFSASSQLFLYRKTDDDAAGKSNEDPQSWEEVVEQTRGSTYGHALRLSPGRYVVSDFLAILGSLEPSVGTPSFDEKLRAATERAMRTFRALSHDRTYEDSPQNDLELMTYLLTPDVEVDSAIVWSSWWMTLETIPALRDRLSRYVVTDEFPGDKPLLSAWMLVIPKNANNPMGAKKLMRHAIRYSTQKALASNLGVPPVWREIYPLLAKADRETDQKIMHNRYLSLRNSLDNARPRPRSSAWPEREGALSSELVRLILLDARAAAEGESHNAPGSSVRRDETPTDELDDLYKEVKALVSPSDTTTLLVTQKKDPSTNP